MVPDKRATLELDSLMAIVAMVSAGLGVSVVQLAEPAMSLLYPARVLPLGRKAPTLRISLVTRKSDDDDRRLLAVRESMLDALAAPARRHALRLLG